MTEAEKELMMMSKTKREKVLAKEASAA